MLPPKCMCLTPELLTAAKYPWDLAIAEPPQYLRSPGGGTRGHAPGKKTVWKTESTKIFFWSYIWIFSDLQGSDHRVVGKEAGFGISVKNNSYRAISGVNSTETILLGAPPLSRSPQCSLSICFGQFLSRCEVSIARPGPSGHKRPR